MWLWLILLLLLIIVVLFFMDKKVSKIRQATQTQPQYHVYVPAEGGRYYMCALGVTKETVSQLIINNMGEAKITPYDLQEATSLISTGTLVFYFRALDDQRPLKGNEQEFLNPLGSEEGLTMSDRFSLAPDGSLLIPVFNSTNVLICTDSADNKLVSCVPGSCAFGDKITGQKLQLEMVGGRGAGDWKVKLVQDGQDRNYLALGAPLCSYLKADNSQRKKSKLDERCEVLGVNGGPVIPKINGQGHVFYLQTL